MSVECRVEWVKSQKIAETREKHETPLLRHPFILDLERLSGQTLLLPPFKIAEFTT